MSRHYFDIAFTDPVIKAQTHFGSRAAQKRHQQRLDQLSDSSTPRPDSRGSASGGGGPAQAAEPQDAMTDVERRFIGLQDSFYLSTVSNTGWPYVQFRGGPAGFAKVPDDHTVAWADFRGNRQYISTGNLSQDNRVALIFLDYARQSRLKIYGHASVVDVPGHEYSGDFALDGYDARVEREVRITVLSYDWNCPQHITPKYTASELAPILEPMKRKVADLEAENVRLKDELERRS